MPSLRLKPAPPLDALIDCLWYWQGAPTSHTYERLLPNGESALIFNLHSDPIRIYDAQNLNNFQTFGNAVLSGARSNCFVIDTHQQECVIGVEFRPGGAFPFFQFPACEVENLSVDLTDLWPTRTSEIREQLLAAPNPTAKLATLERCLRQQFVRPPELHPVVHHALSCFLRAPHSSTINAVTDRMALSPRRFIDVFHRQVGLKPKAFTRVRRFQQVLKTVHDAYHVDWSQIALDCGYYDQPHFIHDFKFFSGLTPNAYLAARTPNLNHVAIP